jgi:photosystem II stability/assembly factor-like uncharacterized protein
MKFITALLIGLAAVGFGITSASAVLLVGDPSGTSAVDNSTGEADTSVADRLRAMAERFGTDQGEDFKQATLAAALLQSALFPAQLAGATPQPGTPQWRAVGPTFAKYQTNGITLKVSDSGRVSRVLQDPNDPDTVYVLTAGGGLWKTRTFSQTNPRWIPLTDSQPSTSGGNMAFGRDPQTLYVGIGDPLNPNHPPALIGGMIKSTDGGDTWSSFVSLVGAHFVADVAVDTSGDSDVVLVATELALFRSSDGGQSYSPVVSGSFWSFANTSAGWLAATNNGVIYRSTDQGATWTVIPNPGNGYSDAGRTTLGVAAPGDSVVYAFATTPLNFASPCGLGFFGSPLFVCQRDLFRSTDGGLSWTALGITTKVPTNPNGFQPTMDLMQSQAGYNQMILVDPGDPSRNTVYLGGELSSAKTTDGGATWTLISDWLPGIFSNLPYVHADFHTASSLQLKGSPAIVFGTDGGIFVSSDGGASFDFEKNDGLDSQLAQTVMSSAKNPETFALGMQDTGTRVRMGSSGVYNQVTGGDGEGIGWSQANNAVTLTSVGGGTILRSEGLLPNTFGNFVFATPRLVRGDSYLFFTKIATPSAIADPAGLTFLTASQQTVFITPDGAQNWFWCARAGVNLFGGVGLPSSFSVRDNNNGIGLDPTDADFSKPGPFGRVAVTGTRGQIAFTLDGCLTWTVKDLIALVPGYQGFNASPAWMPNGAGLYVAAESNIPGSVRVVKSLDRGNTWQRADGGLPNVPVFHLVVDPRDASGNSLYAATALGVYRTTNGGANWTLFGAGLPTVRVIGLWISPDGGLLRAATYGRGAWEINP